MMNSLCTHTFIQLHIPIFFPIIKNCYCYCIDSYKQSPTYQSVNTKYIKLDYSIYIACFGVDNLCYSMYSAKYYLI